MATINIVIGGSLNKSLSIGDTAYYIALGNVVAGFQRDNGNLTALGLVTAISSSANQITVDVDNTTINANTLNNKMLLFSKDNKVNTSGLTGYYAEVKMTNTSLIESELYSVSSDIVQSSK